jgi:hypothetical protein
VDFVLCTRKFYLRVILYYGGLHIRRLRAAVILSIANVINMYASVLSAAGAHRAMSSGTQMPGAA